MKKSIWFLLTLLMLTVCAAAVFIGPAHHPGSDILLKIRLPRVLAGLIAGAGLASAGAVFQGLLRNPLADPYILGASSGAGAGVILALLLGAGRTSPVFYLLVCSGALGATFLSYSLARIDRKVPIVNLLLSGVIVSTFLGALIVLFISLMRSESISAFFFLIGSITENDFLTLAVSSMLVAAGLSTALAFSRQLDILSLGEEKAGHLGVDAETLKTVLFCASALMVGAAVALSGTIGFVGLIVPHAVRLIAGPGHRRLIPASALGGGIFLVAMDAVARTAAAPMEIPVGVLTALTGAPFFIWLLRKKKKEIL
ncbi:MAG: iron ABC transporter permease [bacterium]